jgi:hypothetical protein
MERSRWIALAIVILYVAVEVLVVAPHPPMEGPTDPESFPGQRAASFLALIALASIWWPEVVGAVVLMCRFGPIPDRWAVVVRVLGWVLLIAVVAIRFQRILPA